MSPHNGSTFAPLTLTAALVRRYGTCDGRSAPAREISADSWQVKVHHHTSPRVGHDGWAMLGADIGGRRHRPDLRPRRNVP
jgi:hypothetical protein